MSKHPVNLAIRFLLEFSAIVVFGIWGYGLTAEWPRFVLAITFPLVFAVLWGVFAVQNDPSRSGKTVVPTPGMIRLILELGLFAASAWMLIDLGYSHIAMIFGIAVGAHYIFSFDRIIWLLKQK